MVPAARGRGVLLRDLDLHLRSDVFPGLELVGEPRLGVVERLVGNDVEVLLVEGIDHRLCLQRLQRGREQGLQHLLRRSRGRKQPLPGDRADAGIADLLHGRDIRIFGQALVVDQRQRPQLAGLDLRRGRGRVQEGDLTVTGDHVVDDAGGAVLVVDGDHVEIARALGEIGHVEVRIAAGTHGAVAHLAGIALGVGDQLRNGLHVEVGRGREQEFRNVVDHGHRDHAALVIRQLRGRQHRRDGIGRDIADHHGIAVGLGVEHLVDRDDAVGARLVLDHEGLAQDLPQLLAQDAGHDVGGAAGRVRHHDLHRLGGILVLRRGRDAEHAQQRESQPKALHPFPPVGPAHFVRWPLWRALWAETVAQARKRRQRNGARDLVAPNGCGNR